MKATKKPARAAQGCRASFFQKPALRLAVVLLLALPLFCSLGCGDDEQGCGLECKNEGSLLPTCACVCKPRWTGGDCSVQVTPDRLRLVSYKLKKFPTHRPDGSPWDSNGTPPDLWLSIRQDNSEWDFMETDALLNASPGQDYDFQPAGDSETYSVSMSLNLHLWDCDLASDCDDEHSEEMGVIPFKFYENDNGFPDILALASEDGSLEVELQIEYIHE